MIPKLSICIPTYNRLSHLKLTVEYLRQTFRDVTHELVVVDSGSTDGTLEWLEALGREMAVTVVRQPEPLGALRACLPAFQASRGEYILLRHDHSFTIIQPIMDAIALMDAAPQVDVVFEKVYKAPRPMHKTAVCASYFGVMEAFVLRNTGSFDVDGDFCSYGWGLDLVLRLLTKGRIVAGLRQLSFIDTDLSDEGRDPLHQKFKFGARNNIARDIELFDQKCVALRRLTERFLPWHVRLMHPLWLALYGVTRWFTQTRGAALLSAMFDRLGHRMPPVMPSLDRDRLGVPVPEDGRLNIPGFERFYDWTYEKCCPFSNAGMLPPVHRRPFYLVQSLPLAMVEAIRDARLYRPTEVIFATP